MRDERPAACNREKERNEIASSNTCEKCQCGERFFGDNVIKLLLRLFSLKPVWWIHEDNYVSSPTPTFLLFSHTFAYDTSDFVHCRPPFLNILKDR